MRARRESAGLVALALAGACSAPARPAVVAPAPPEVAAAETREGAPSPAIAPRMPTEGPRRVTMTTSLVVLEPVRFVGPTATIDASSGPMLDAVAATFVDNVDLQLIEVRAYGADAADGSREALGFARAQRVVEALVARGVAPDRLLPVGAARPPSGAVVGDPGPELLIVRRAGQP